MVNKISDPKQEETIKPVGVDKDRRRFLLTSAGVLSGIGALCALKPLLTSWMPTDKVQAEAAPVTVDLSNLQYGEQKIISWRGKPVWIVRRNQTMLNQLQNDTPLLRDPNSLVDQQPEYAKNIYRSINPEYLVLIGVCTHLGCSPKFKPNPGELGVDWPGGFYCPCHGSTFDLSGRVFKDVPAPINLQVPPYYFLNDHTLIIGEDKP